MTDKEILNHLSIRYCQPDYVFLSRVRNSTGFPNQVRTADALAMGMYPSRGLEIEGFEIKVSRSDFLAELKNPAKAEEIQKYCDRWWLVIPDKEIVKNDLPSTWGLILVKNNCRTVIPAPKLEPVEINRPFLASLLRRATENTTPIDTIQEQLNQQFKRGQDNTKTEMKYVQEKYDRLRERIEEFEKKSGVNIDSYDAGNIGEKVGFVLQNESYMARRIANLKEEVLNILKELSI